MKLMKKVLALALSGVMMLTVAPVVSPNTQISKASTAQAVKNGTAHVSGDSTAFVYSFTNSANLSISKVVAAGDASATDIKATAKITLKESTAAASDETTFHFTTNGATAGKYVVTVTDDNGTAVSDDFTLTVVGGLASSTPTASVLPGETVQTSISNVVGDLSLEYASTLANNLDTAQNDVSITGKLVSEMFKATTTGSGTTKTLNITPVAGKVIPGIYTITAEEANTGASLTAVTITVKPYDLGSSMSMDLGLTDTGVAYFKGINQTYSVDGTDNNVAQTVAAVAATKGSDIAGVCATGDYFVKVNVTAASSVGGTKAYVINGADGKKYGTVTVTSADKSKLTGVSATASVLVEKSVSLLPLVANSTTNYDASKITVVDKKGDTIDMSTTNYHFGFAATPTGFLTSDIADAATSETINVTGKIAGTTNVKVTAYNAVGHVAANAIASATCAVTVLGKQAITVTDEKGTVLGGDSALALDLVKNKTKTVTINKPEGTTATVKSANDKVATATNEGVITAVGVGRTTITVETAKTATLDALSVTFDVVVTAKPANNLVVTDDKGLTLSNTKGAYVAANHNALKLDLKTRTEGSIVVAQDDSTSQVTFETTSSYFSVDKYTGKITTKANTTGTGYVTIRSTETASVLPATYIVYVSVTEKPEDVITAKANSVKVVKGKTYDLEAKSAAGATLTYASGDAAIAAVDASGKITGVAAGDTNIVITAAATENTILTTKTIAVHVNEYSDNTIVIKTVDGGAEVGDELKITGPTKVTITATGSPAITVTDKNPTIVKTSLENGVYTLTPGENGSAVIEITADAVADGVNNFEETTRYLVVTYGKVEGTITADEAVSVMEGSTAQITASASNGNPVEFSSIDTSVATVDTTGLVTGVKAGTTVVIVSATDCKQTFVKITVTGKKANTIKVTGKTAKVKKGKKVTLKVAKVLTVKNAQGTVTYTKKSGNKKITIAKSTGKVTVKKGLKKGTYSVKVAVKAAGNATYKAKTVTKTFKIKVK